MKKKNLSLLDCLLVWAIGLCAHLIVYGLFGNKSPHDMQTYLSGHSGFLILLVIYNLINYENNDTSN